MPYENRKSKHAKACVIDAVTKKKRRNAQIEYIEVEDQHVSARRRDNRKTKPFYDALKSDKDIFVWTGIPNNQMLKNIELCVRQLGKPTPIIKGFDISIRGLIVLVLVRLKVNLSFDQMAIIFKMRPIQLSKYFAEFLPMLKIATENTILTSTASTKDELVTQRNLTKCLQEDCTDIEIDKPKVLVIGKTDPHSMYKGTFNIFLFINEKLSIYISLVSTSTMLTQLF